MGNNSKKKSKQKTEFFILDFFGCYLRGLRSGAFYLESQVISAIFLRRPFQDNLQQTLFRKRNLI